MAHVMTYLSKVNWKNDNRSPYQGVVKRNWVPTGRIDFATHLDGSAEDADQPSDFKLLVEERRIVESIAGNEQSGDTMAAGYLERSKSSRDAVPQISVRKLTYKIRI